MVASISVYVFTRPPPISLTVSDGSTTGVIEANFANYSSIAPFVRYFNTTTYAIQTGGPTSVLTLRLFTYTFPVGNYSAGGFLDVNIVATVRGRIASNLHLDGLALTYNETGQFLNATGAPGGSAVSYIVPEPINVTFCESCSASQVIGLTNDGAGTLTPDLVNQTGVGPVYAFVFPMMFEITERPGYGFFAGFRATVTGQFTPAVSVGIFFKVIDVPA